MTIILQHVFEMDLKILKAVYNGFEALDELARDIEENNNKGLGRVSSYCLILMDCSMPMLDGYETTEIIRQVFFKQNLTQPVISALTGHTDH